MKPRVRIGSKDYSRLYYYLIMKEAAYKTPIMSYGIIICYCNYKIRKILKALPK